MDRRGVHAHMRRRSIVGLRAASDILGEVDIGGAGRTDSGVHATAQVAHLRSRKAHDPLLLTRKLNDLLPRYATDRPMSLVVLREKTT